MKKYIFILRNNNTNHVFLLLRSWVTPKGQARALDTKQQVKNLIGVFVRKFLYIGVNSLHLLAVRESTRNI